MCYMRRHLGGDLFFGNLPAGIQKNEDRRTGTTQGGTEDAVCTSELLNRGQQRAERGAIGLVDAIVERGSEKVWFSLREGCEQEHGVLDVGDGVGARVLRREDATSFFGGERVGRDGEQQGPVPFGLEAGDLRFSFSGHAGDGESAHPAGGGVVGMVLAAGSLADDL